MIKESWNLTGWPHPTKSCSLKCYHPLMIITTQKIKDITKRPYTAKKKKKKKKKKKNSLVLPWLDDYRHVKNKPRSLDSFNIY